MRRSPPNLFPAARGIDDDISGPPWRCRHRRLVARGGRFDRRRGAVRRAARRRPAGAAGAGSRSSGGSAMSPTPRSRSCSAPRSATMRPDKRPSPSSSTAMREVRRAGYVGPVGRAVEPDPECLRAAGRQGLSVQRTAGEGRERRRDRRRAGPRTRPSQASRQHARADPQRRHVVPDRPAVRRHHRLQRVDLRLAHAGRRRPIRAKPSSNADSFAIDVMQRLGRPPKPVGELLFRVTGKEGDKGLSIISSHPADRGPAGADEPGRSAGERAAAADTLRNGGR